MYQNLKNSIILKARLTEIPTILLTLAAPSLPCSCLKTLPVACLHLLNQAVSACT